MLKNIYLCCVTNSKKISVCYFSLRLETVKITIHLFTRSIDTYLLSVVVVLKHVHRFFDTFPINKVNSILLNIGWYLILFIKRMSEIMLLESQDIVEKGQAVL